MRKKLKALSAAILAATLFITAAQAEGAEASAFERYLAEGVYPSLKESYRDLFMIGAAVTPELLAETAGKIAQIGVAALQRDGLHRQIAF